MHQDHTTLPLFATGPASPKRKTQRGDAWFDYYAGYADEFVAQMVAAVDPAPTLILDPWNGSGTTTSVAAARGLASLGLDINPAAVIVAKARLTRSDVADSLLPLCEEILSHARSGKGHADDNELLLRWTQPRTAAYIRRIERAISGILVPAEAGRPVDAQSLDQHSALACLFLLALFRVVRELLTPFRTTNPTWLRLRVKPQERVTASRTWLTSRMRAEVTSLADSARSNSFPIDSPDAVVRLATSNKLPLDNASVDAVITSPPYCTRIDYAVAMAPELAAIGMTVSEWDALREQMIGTPSITKPDLSVASSSSELAKLFSTIANHKSYAATDYYLPFYARYFSEMRTSLRELGRVMRPDRSVVLVVQDSYFKDVHVDTPTVLTEFASDLGWTPVESHHFQVLTRAAMHPHRREHRAQSTATETVTILRT